MQSRLGAVLLIALLAGFTACGAPSHPKATPPVKKTTTPPGKASSQAPAKWPSQPLAFNQLPPIQPPAGQSSVNGCDPYAVGSAGPFNMCLSSSVPKFWCCSPAYDNWSGILAGSTVDLKGGVEIDPSTGKPVAPDVLVLDPYGGKTLIPVSPNGAFDQNVSFPRAGQYQLGIYYQGKPMEMTPFDVAWNYVIPKGVPTISSLFPGSSRSWPSYDVFLAAPADQTTTYTFTAVNAQGVPQPGVVLGFTGAVTDAQANAAIKIARPVGTAFSPPLAIAPNLFAQAYVDVTAQGGTLAGFPQRKDGVIPAVRSLSEGGTTSYNVIDFLIAMDDGFAPTSGSSQQPLVWNASTDTLTLTDYGAGATARLLADTGEVDVGVWQNNAWTWKPFGTTSPVMKGGQVYLSVPDLITLSNAFAWAAPDGKGGLLFSDSSIP